MENTSKALLIAAGVLIVILIVTIGIRIVSSTGNVEESSKEVGDSISEKIKDAASSIAGKYVGYYADIDGNGTVDGIIYEDLKSGKLNNYNISKTNHNGPFGTKDVIAPIKGKANNRFYVMALNDFNPGYTYAWYDAAYSNQINDYYGVTSKKFGTGKANTQTMIEKWNNKAYGEQNTNVNSKKDIWGPIQTKANSGWFVPSIGEWSKFKDNLGITNENYIKYGLASNWYWSSSLRTQNVAENIGVGSGYSAGYLYVSLSLRLSIIF